MKKAIKTTYFGLVGLFFFIAGLHTCIYITESEKYNLFFIAAAQAAAAAWFLCLWFYRSFINK